MDQVLTKHPLGPRLRVFLADDHPIVLSGMKMLVAEAPELELVGEANDGPKALRRAIELRPDVAVFDLSMPGMNGIDVTEKYLDAIPKARVLVLSVHEDGAYLRRLLKLGVGGYILKRSATDELIRGIHAVASGGLYLDPAIAGRAIGRGVQKVSIDSETSPISELSTRELEVLRLASVGHSNKVISAKLQVGSKSVETYKARAMDKLGFTNRVELIRFALSMGWLESAEP
ncbi:response regulator [Rhodopseudomonas pseudopalustris]|uniref:Two component transcriptional regulator, LuxR family n=2 Tax=Rhodopseudomonas TaxID=1073 RepID=Q137V8_RHOPS|nr:response regulator transcription factor [Rhodopseudomonas pseudopalustris]ABE39631.1 two component transcriptional regulator, LuxR family [Rhodopseudomonas palustris BisB5]MBB1094194.1 response regulator transcription factor [Rhodopseudomonas palustris]SEP19845.1 two component transcriptional regulator, LuxR family [Rhodopseudomonas pseudopalustris]